MQITEKHISDIPKQKDHQAVEQVIEQHNKAPKQLITWATKRLKTASLDKITFQYIYDKPLQWSGVTIVALAEYGIGIHSGLILRSLCIRQTVDRNAALIIIPNESLGSCGYNFSNREKRELSIGNVAPAIERIRVVINKEHKGGKLLLYGPSQAAVILSAFAADIDVTSSVALTVVEPPHIQNRRRLRLVKDFLTSGNKLQNNIVSNFEHTKTQSLLRDELLHGINLKNMASYGIGAIKSQNRALAGVMRVCTLGQNIEAILEKGIPVVHAWGEHGTLSGNEQNSQIAESIAPDARYMPIRMLGEEADHSITNRYALNARLVRMSLDMLRSS